MEARTIQVLHVHNGLAFPHVEQVAHIERTVERRKSKGSEKVRTHEEVYVITSQYPEQVRPLEILSQVRRHWTVESVHWTRDVTYDEDRSQVRTGSGPQAMAGLRNLAISLIRSWGFRTVPDGNRRYWSQPEDLLTALSV